MLVGRDQGASAGWRFVLGKDVLAGAFFVAIAGSALWISRNYPMGTAFRMGTGYIPRLLCWILLGLGIAILTQALRRREPPGAETARRRPLIFVPASLIAFALTIQRFGIVVAALLLIAIGSLAGRELRPAETAIAAGFLIILTLAIFVWGLGLPIPVWPED